MAAVGTQLRTPSGNANGISRLSMMQAKLREQLMLEKESRLLEMAARQDAEREDIINRVTKTSANSLSSSMSSLNSSGAGQGRVRKMFEERRGTNSRGYHQSPKGYDKSYPLDPVHKKEGGKPPMKGQHGRGVSVDRAQGYSDDAPMNRSRSQVPAFQKANRGDNRLQRPPKGPPGGGSRGLPTHHKSTSSLMEGNHHTYNGSSRGPSPVPPSSTKSSPGPRGPPATSQRRISTRNPPPTSKKNNYLTVNGNGHEDNRSLSPAPTTPRESEGKGFFAKLGFRTPSTPKPPATSKTLKPPATSKPPGTANKLSVNSKPSGLFTPLRNLKSPVPDHLRKCKTCGRNFDPDRIQKHEAICTQTKAKAKKRKAFDPVKMRTKGTEAERFVARGDHLKENKKIKAKKNNWRKKHEDFIKTVRAAKGVKGYDEAPPIDKSDYIDCPHCGRKFSEQVADRHIPKCADITSNKTNRKADQRAPPTRAAPTKAPPPPSRRKR